MWGSIAIVQTAAFSESLKSISREELTGYEDYYVSMLKFKPERGINASSIADIFDMLGSRIEDLQHLSI